MIATGGLASLFGTGSKYIKQVDEFLTLEGLRIIWERNAARQTCREACTGAPSLFRQQAALPLELSWKTTSTISPKSRNIFSGAAGALCCCPRWTGR